MELKNLENPFFDAPVYYREVTDSTMKDSKRMADKGIPHGTVFLSDFQSNGRGRIKGRKWISHKGENLLFTLVLNRNMIEQEIHHMPLLAGAALLDAVQKYTGSSFSLKWPNDLLWRGKKCSGILCEADNVYFYCGIGVNCNQKNFPDELKNKSSSLKMINGENIETSRLLEQILNSFHKLLNGGESWRNFVEKSLYRTGEIIEVLMGQADSGSLIRGINMGIGEEGQLLLRDKKGVIHEIFAGEIEI